MRRKIHSTVFRRLFLSYLTNPTYMRERYIYSENYYAITKAIELRRTITFNTTKNPTLSHSVHPYKIVYGSEEMFNYLICSELDSEGILRAKTYRLCRINNIRYSRANVDITEKIKDYMERMIQYSPAYEINDDEVCCVYLSEKGHESYKQIYFQRPEYSKIKNAGSGYMYYFNGSKQHIMQYFKRFNPGEAIIIKPSSLKQNMLDSYRSAYKVYQTLFDDK